jgi:transposase
MNKIKKKELIEAAVILRESEWKIIRISKILSVNYNTVYNWIKLYEQAQTK